MGVFEIWFTKPIGERLLDVSILLASIGILGWGFIIFIRKLKEINASFKAGKEGIEINTSNNEDAPVLQPIPLTTVYSPAEQVINEAMETLMKMIKDRDDKIAFLEGKININNQELYEMKYKDKYNTEMDQSKRKTLIPFSQHEVFVNLLKYIERGIHFNFEKDMNPLKIVIAKSFLEDCKVKVFYDNLRAFVVAIELLKTEEEKINMLSTIINRIYDWIEEYNKKAEDIRIDLPDGTCIYGIPSVFIKKFDDWHSQHVDATVLKIKQTFYSSFYTSWQLKLIMILDHIDTAFLLTVKDAEKTLLSLNGDLEEEIQKRTKQAACRS